MKSDGGLRGDADCHSQCAHWLRNDTVNKKRGGAAGHMGPALQPYIFVGQGPCALPGVRCGIGGRTEASAPTEAQQEVQWAGDRKGRPYESVTKGAIVIGRRGEGTPPYIILCYFVARGGGAARGLSPVNRAGERPALWVEFLLLTYSDRRSSRR